MANDLLIKYKVSDLARDLGQPAKQVIDELAAVTGEAKKPGANLSKEELNLVMDQLTKGAQEQDLTCLLYTSCFFAAAFRLPIEGKAFCRGN